MSRSETTPASFTGAAPADFDTLLVSVYELGHQPIGVAMPAAFLLEAGHRVRCLDVAVEPLDEEAIAAADLIGISVPMHTALRLGVLLARRVRAVHPACHICCYGLYASLNAEYLLGEVADSVIGGEFEQPLVELVGVLSTRGAVAEPIDGVRTRDHPTEPHLGRQPSLPPARHLLPPLDRYARLDTGSERRLAGEVEASRGCAHTCLHCPITPVYQRRVRIVAADVVLEDIANLVRMGAEHVTFADPDFFNGVKHSLHVAARLHAEFPHLTFDATVKVEHILEHRSLLPRFAALGLLFIVSAVESLDDRTLGFYAKSHTRADVLEALAICDAVGVALRPTFVAFSPWTTIESYLDMLRFVAEHGLVYSVDPVQFTLELLVPPGSSLLGTPQLEPYLGNLDPANFRYAWRYRDPRLAELHREVGAVVESAAASKEDEQVTFDRILELAEARIDGDATGRVSDGPARRVRRRSPALTHSWFC